MNTINGKRYIGSSVDIFRRLKEHRKLLRAGKHHSTHLQFAWRKYGAAAFSMTILLICGSVECVANEQNLIDQFQSANRKFGYNASPTAGSIFGLKWSPESKARKSAQTKAYLAIPENFEKCFALSKTDAHKKKMSDIGKLRFQCPEHREKMLKLMKRKGPQSPEVRKRIADKLRGRKQPTELVARRAASNRGKHHTQETKDRISALQKGRPKHAGFKAIMRASWVLRRQKEQQAKDQLTPSLF